jgi:Protein of unknown function (DUF2917)
MLNIPNQRLCKVNASSIFILTMNVKGTAMNLTLNTHSAALNAICLGVADANNITMSLERQGMIRLPQGASLCVKCLDGALWVTLDHDARDIVLEPGEAFTTPADRGGIVYALKPSRMTVVAPSPLGAIQAPTPTPTVPSDGLRSRLTLATQLAWR